VQNEEHLCLIAVIGMEILDKERPENVERERETGMETRVCGQNWKLEKSQELSNCASCTRGKARRTQLFVL